MLQTSSEQLVLVLMLLKSTAKNAERVNTAIRMRKLRYFQGDRCGVGSGSASMFGR